jgi:nitronate monooxygenase
MGEGTAWVEAPAFMPGRTSTDGRGLAAALMLGAEGVVMGTRFAVASESLAAPGAKARVVAASGDETLRTTVFDIARGYT